MAKSKSTIKQEKSGKKDKRQVKEIESEDEFDQKLESTVNDTEFKLDAMTIEGEEETIEEDEEEKFSGDELNFPESDSDGSETLNEGDDDEEDGDDETVENGDDDDEEELDSDPDVSEEDNEDSDSEFDWEEETKPKNERKAKKDPNAPLPEIDPVYDSDSSTEETENTIGNVPMEWYDEFPHIGYTVDGKKIYRPAQGDELDKFLDQMDDPDAWKTVRDEAAQQNVKLSKEELEIIKKVQLGQFPQADYNPYEPTIEYFSSKVEEMPLSAAPEPKRRFQPSKWENQKIMKLVRAIRAGKIVLKKVKKNKTPKSYNLWDESAENKMRDKDFMPPPKKSLPDHSESYNPPEEYLFNDEEKEEWKNTAPEDREKDFIPEK
jgi:ribosome biogenesis protein ERB1